MTEGSLIQHDRPMCVRIWLEVGHACEPRRSHGRSRSLDWRVWVRGVGGTDISTFVHKVVFHLHPPSAFVYPKRVLQEPPYEIVESGCASIEIPIHVYLKYTSKPKKIRMLYSLQIENSRRSSSESRCVFYDLENPTEELWRSLMKGGGEVVGRTDEMYGRAGKLVVVLSDSDEKTHKCCRTMNKKKYKFIKPIKCKHILKKDTTKVLLHEDICSKCSDASNVDFKKLLSSMAMTDDEINRVSQLYLSYSNYEKSAEALILPPITDPIYRLPELPCSLRGALSSVEADFSMQ